MTPAKKIGDYNMTVGVHRAFDSGRQTAII